jgi:hypothetical protein
MYRTLYSVLGGAATCAAKRSRCVLVPVEEEEEEAQAESTGYVRLMRPKLVAVKLKVLALGGWVVLQEVAGHRGVVYVCVRGGEEAEG